jgi:hypothetical protein
MIPATFDEWVFVVCMVVVGALVGFTSGTRPRPALTVAVAAAMCVGALLAISARHAG